LHGGADLTFATLQAAYSQSERQIQSSTRTIICQWSFDSNIRKRIRRDGVRMLESDHWHQLEELRTMNPRFSVGISESAPASADFPVTGRSRNRDITSFVWLSFRS
jgi:hypothetical protein